MTGPGGLQKEAYFVCRYHVVPGDRMATVARGWNRLWTSSVWRERSDVADFGRGDAAERVIAMIREAAP